MSDTSYAIGDLVIYTKTKHSARPGPRARQVDPAPHGDQYSYQVDKFWIVADIRARNVVVLATRRGKVHEVSCLDPNLRHASWWERLIYRGRFPNAAPVIVVDPNRAD